MCFLVPTVWWYFRAFAVQFEYYCILIKQYLHRIKFGTVLRLPMPFCVS